MPRLALMTSLFLFVVAGVNCIPMTARSRASMRDSRVIFTDKAGTDPGGPVLILPVYMSALGYGIGAGDGPTGSTGLQIYVAHPVVCRSGEKFRLREGRNTGILIFLPFTFIGKMSGLEGAISVAPGYRISYAKEDPVRSAWLRLAPEPPDQSREDLGELAVLLKERWVDFHVLEQRAHVEGLPDLEEKSLEIRLSAAERRMINTFFAGILDDASQE